MGNQLKRSVTDLRSMGISSVDDLTDVQWLSLLEAHAIDSRMRLSDVIECLYDENDNRYVKQFDLTYGFNSYEDSTPEMLDYFFVFIKNKKMSISIELNDEFRRELDCFVDNAFEAVERDFMYFTDVESYERWGYANS